MTNETEILYGINLSKEVIANRSDDVISLHVTSTRKDKRLNELIQTAESKNISIHTEEDDFFKSYDADHKAKVCIKCKIRREEKESFLKDLIKKDKLLLLILDHLTDPQNVGACLRSAAAAGVDAVIAPKNRSCHLTPTVRRVSSGYSELIPFVVVTNLNRTLNFLYESGIEIIGSDSSSEHEYNAVEYTNKTAFVIGSEDKGMKRLTKENCSQLIKIPMANNVESLNASVSAGIILFEFLRQKSAK